MKHTAVILFILILAQTCHSQNEKEKVQYKSYGRCDGCEGVFEYGNRKLQAVDTLPDYEKYDDKIKLVGTIYQPDGNTPAHGVILYAYQTNPEGIYPKKGDETGLAKKQGYIRGWVKTDSSGRYTLYTFLPGSYSSGAAHIHTAVLEPNGRYYYIDDFNFEGDPHLDISAVQRQWGGSGIVKLQRKGEEVIAERDIILGLNVENYE